MAPPRRPGITHLVKTSGISLIIHIAIAVFLSLNPWPTITKIQPMAYTVTFMPVPITEPEISKPPPPPPPVPKEEKIKPIEKVKPIEKSKPVEKPKKDDIVEKVKKKERDEESLKSLQGALEEIRKKIALDDIQKRVAQKERSQQERSQQERSQKEREEERPATPLPTPPQISSSKPSPELLTIYSSIVKAKILQEWTIPENLLKEMVDLETIIVVIIERDGKIQKPRLEKKSGNAIYDQSAMRAIKKAEPFPPIPKELGENTLEYEMRFTPDLIR